MELWAVLPPSPHVMSVSLQKIHVGVLNLKEVYSITEFFICPYVSPVRLCPCMEAGWKVIYGQQT